MYFKEAQSDEYGSGETNDCETLWACWVPAIHDFFLQPQYLSLNNINVARVCS